MRTTIYIPSFNGRERLRALLESLRLQTKDCRIVVAENGSADGTSEMVRNDFPGVKLAEMGGNIGFGRALNRAIADYPGDPIILLNQDVVCPPDFLDKLLRVAAGGAEMVAAVLASERNPERIDSCGVIADRTLMGFDYLHGEPLSAARSAAPPIGPTGGGALYRADAFHDVGGFDERIFLYYEDLDLALRLRNEGARCELAADAVASHGYSQSLGAGSPAKYARTGWSRGYMLRRYGVLQNPHNAVRVLAAEGAICLAQIVADRTFEGVRGRLEGWRAGRGLPRQAIPSTALGDYSLIQSLSMRRRRRG